LQRAREKGKRLNHAFISLWPREEGGKGDIAPVALKGGKKKKGKGVSGLGVATNRKIISSLGATPENATERSERGAMGSTEKPD